MDVLTLAVILNVAALVVGVAPLLASYAEGAPHAVTCSICANPDVQRALAHAPSIGRGQVLQDLQSTLPVLAVLSAANIAFLVGFAFAGRWRRAA